MRRTSKPKGNARSSGYERATSDWYIEPRRSVDALLDVENFTGVILDPACGSGNIPDACSARGLIAMGSDIVDRGWPGTRISDFAFAPLAECDSIITNPPFNLAVTFALNALDVVRDRVAILQRTTWLEGQERHKQIFSRGHLMRVWQFSSRISMPPGESDAEAKGGSVAFAWFVFSRSHKGPAALGWLP